MKLVIDIDNEKYKIISDHIKATRDVISKNGYANNDVVPIGWVAIADGEPLPKGHGELVDKNELMKAYAPFEFTGDMGDAMEILDNFDTIIESDKEGE